MFDKLPTQATPSIMFIVEILPKLVFSGIFVLIISLCATEVWRIWVPGKPVLAAFTYTKDGQASPEKGSHFAQLVRQDMSQVVRTHQRYDATMRDLLAGKVDNWNRSDEDRRAWRDFQEPENMPRRSIAGELELSKGLPDLDIEYQGINLTAILKRLRRTIRKPNEITGTVRERLGRLDIQAEHQGAKDSWRGFVFDAPSIDEASWELAAKLFHVLDKERMHAVYSIATDEEFALFMKALRQYHLYFDRNGEEKIRR